MGETAQAEVLSAVGHTPGLEGPVHASGIDGKGCCEWLAVWEHSRRVIRLSHAWLRNSDRSVRSPRLIGTACPLYHIVVRKKENRKLGKKEFWLLVIFNCVSTLIDVPCKSRILSS